MYNSNIDQKFKQLRTTVRKSAKNIIHNILDNHYDPYNFAGLPDICIFCGNSNDLTKEHVLPRWVFEGKTDTSFRTNSNGILQTFNKTVVPACTVCNTTYLAFIENHIKKLFELEIDYFDKHIGREELLNIIRWIEIIEYKFHVLNFRRKYRSSKRFGYEPSLAEVPIAVWRESSNYSPYQATAQLRKAQKQLTTKNKDSNFNSLVIFGVRIPQLKLYHAMSMYLYLELPQFHKSFVYFFNQEFDDYSIAEKEALEVIKAEHRSQYDTDA